jgi:hypothetical protein
MAQTVDVLNLDAIDPFSIAWEIDEVLAARDFLIVSSIQIGDRDNFGFIFIFNGAGLYRIIGFFGRQLLFLAFLLSSCFLYSSTHSLRKAAWLGSVSDKGMRLPSFTNSGWLA